MPLYNNYEQPSSRDMEGQLANIYTERTLLFRMDLLHLIQRFRDLSLVMIKYNFYLHIQLFYCSCYCLFKFKIDGNDPGELQLLSNLRRPRVFWNGAARHGGGVASGPLVAVRHIHLSIGSAALGLP